MDVYCRKQFCEPTLYEEPDSHATALRARKLSSPHVAILLAVKNGARFLDAQLRSFSDQTHSNWSLHVSDDGSGDESPEIIRHFKDNASHRVTMRRGPELGPYRNFLSLVQCEDICADYYAFSDQDDIWHRTKIEKAIEVLQSLSDDRPLLYCARTELIDSEGRSIGYSKHYKKRPSFQNALVQNIGGGNTMIFNRRTRELLIKVSDLEGVMHDWLTYLVVSAAGGTVIYDATPLTGYRQHAQNVVGSNAGIRAQAVRLRTMLDGQWRYWNSLNLRILERIWMDMPEEHRATLDHFVRMRQSNSLPQCLLHFWKSGVYRQTLVGRAGLLLALVTRNI